MTIPPIEPLEARIAPAATFTFIDVDGDRVVVTSSLGTNADLAAILVFSDDDRTAPRQLQEIDFSANAAAFSGASVLVTATPRRGAGDGFVNVGYIDGTALDGDGESLVLRNVTIEGDLGRFSVGTESPLSVNKIAARSMGQLGVLTQPAGATTVSDATGRIGVLQITRDVVNASVLAGSIGSVNIGGSLIGEAGLTSGLIAAEGAIGSISIRGNLVGGTDTRTGVILADEVGTIFIGGSIIGGPGAESGRIDVGSVGAIAIRGNILGSQGALAGSVHTGDVGSFTLRGSVFGGGGAFSPSSGIEGQVFIRGSATAIKVGGLAGGTGDYSGHLHVGENVGVLTVPRSILGGSGEHSGGVNVEGKIGLTIVGGSIVGRDGLFSGRIDAEGYNAIRISGNVQGGAGEDSGVLQDRGDSRGSLLLFGSVVGGDGARSGQISLSNENPGSAANIVIRGDIRGGNGVQSGRLVWDGGLESIHVSGSVLGGASGAAGEIRAHGVQTVVSVSGSVIGSSGDVSGRIVAGDDPQMTVVIGGDLRGGSNEDAGAIIATRLKGVVIGGSFFGGVGSRTGKIAVSDSIDSLVVGGDILGLRAENPALILVGDGALGTTDAADGVVLGTLRVGGSVRFAEILAGYDSNGQGRNADAQIGRVVVRGDWMASSVAAGASPGVDRFFGTADDEVIPDLADDPAIASRIASVVVRGQIYGTTVADDAYGFVAQEIGALRAGERSLPLDLATPEQVLSVGFTGDVTVREIV